VTLETLNPRDPVVQASTLSLTELRHVALLHQTLSFNRAAELAGVSQSALSQSISRLEARLGVTLFNRNRRAVSATAFADLIAQRASSVLNAVDDMGSRIRALRDSRAGGLCFGMGVVPAPLLLNDALAEFNQHHAEVAVRAIVGYPEELAQRAAAGEIEFCVVADLAQFRDSNSLHEHLFQYEFALVCRPGHPLLELNAVGFRDLLHYPVVSYPISNLRAHMIELLETSEDFELMEHNFPSVQIQQPFLLAELVATSNYIMVAPSMQLRDWIDAGRLVARSIFDLRSVIDVNVVWREGLELSPAGERMIETLRQVSARLSATVN